MTPNRLLSKYYEKVITQQVPLKYITDNKDGVVESYISILTDLKNQGLSLEQISQNLTKLSPENVSMLYFNYYTNNNFSNRPKQSVIDEINTFYTTQRLSHSDVLSDYNVWVNDYRINLEKDLIVSITTINNIKIMNSSDISKMLLSPIRYTYITRSTYPRMIIRETNEIRVPTIDDGIDLFNFAIPSYDVPFIQYNPFENNLDEDILMNVGNNYKIYKGESYNPVPLDIVIQSKTETKNKNTLYLTVWIGKQYNKFTRECYVPVEYDLLNNKLTFSIPLKEEDTASLILTRIKSSLSLEINESNIHDESIGAEFIIYNMKIDYTLFSSVVLNTEVFKTFLYVDERSKPEALKKVHRIKYKTFIKNILKDDLLKSSAWITTHNQETSTIEVLPLQTKNVDDNIRLEAGSNYLKIDILKAMNKNIISEIYSILPRLISIYNKNISEYKNQISNYLNSNIFLEKEDKKKGIQENKTSGKNIFNLRQLAKGLIEGGYAESCQCPRQPLIIKQDEIPEWSMKTFIYKGAVQSRTVMPFPPNDPKWWFVCIKKDHPFPGIRVNLGSNAATYPFVPCCFKKPQITAFSGSLYDEIYNRNPRKKTNKKQVVLSSEKLLGSKRLGELPGIVNQVLSRYVETEGIIFYRNGVPTSASSLLHCIFEALQYQKYLNNVDKDANITPKTDLEKEDFVINFRRNLLKVQLPNIDVSKQELYDFNNNEIQELLVNTNVFLDPALYVRIIEELFNINIYVFTTPKNNEGSFAMVEMPRHKLFHTRRFNPARQTILIFKYWEDSHIPQCELIVSYDKQEHNIIERIFQNEMSNIIHDIIIKTTNTLTWSIDPNNINVTTRKNLYNSINSYEILNKSGKIIGQFIDGYGKCRGFQFSPSDIYIGNLTVMIPPAQPENVPTLTELTVLSNVDSVFKVFGNNPTFVSMNEDKLINGLWYKILDLDEGFYIPITPIVNDVRLSDVPIGSKNPFFTNGKNLIKRLNELNKINKIILQIIQWLFLHSEMNLRDFIEIHMTVPKERQIVDSETYYNIRRVPRKFPILNNFDEALDYIGTVIPTLVIGRKIVLYSKRYAEGIIYFLKEYLKSVDTSDIKIPINIRGKFTNEHDFNQYTNTVIFVKESDMRTWLYSRLHLSIEYSTIRKKIDFSDSIIHEPFLYQEPSGRFYIVQNVMNLHFKRAINCCYNWFNNKVNTGYESEAYPEEIIPNYLLYGISASNIPEPIKDKTDGNENYLRILSYGENEYAAMLPLQ